ncbi:probable LRR receptor-like serine/threonine-protein kinase At3g47570 [Mercurialis annua]|uniref:probable LRR receptor-like serine/threonine-protein kinase At3g47570 n=1 Tax=Mercurialis annua TaxID=3986 RepID=UPI0024ACF0E2|nr:probable LRR receptor-like serine/threonine-protein kinase At3g47570 [Mercurialis annua]
MMLEEKNMSVFLFPILSSILVAISTVAYGHGHDCKKSCGIGEQMKWVPYPFGFSSDCIVQLNCTQETGEIKIGEFQIQNITPDSIFTHLPANCSRSLDSIRPLFGQHYAPTCKNGLLLQNCTKSLDSCVIPTNNFVNQLHIPNCNSKSDNISCYSGDNSGTDVLSYDHLSLTQCKFLFSSFSVGSDSPSVSLEFQQLELDWWLEGSCEVDQIQCSKKANCTDVRLGDGKAGFRCRCLEGFTGDGFENGDGCQSGMVPTEGAFKNSSATKLCGGMLSKSGRRRLLVTITCSVAGFLLAVLVVALLYFVRLRKPTRSCTSSSYPNSLLQASYQDLRDATDGFSSSKLIGAGSFGSVYKGILRETGAVIAVKVINLQRYKAAKSFMAECEALRNIRHRNLVKVLTVCSSIDPQGNEFKGLVYEFMGNGNLEEWLHPLPRVDDTPNKLNLLQRLNIAIDIALALEYLHHHCETPIVHCDLKPSNVLLNDELVGHISDFGIAKFISEGSHDYISSHPSSTIGLRGTIGYMPPEYGLGGEVSKQGDVYSYGVLLLEMFTGKRPTHDMFKDGLSLHEFAKSAFPDRVVDISDPILLHELRRRTNNSPSPSSMQNDRITECLISVIGIGVASSVEAPGERMNIKDITMKLYSIRNKLLATCRT